MSTWLTLDANDLPLVPESLALLEQLEPVLVTLREAAQTASTVLGTVADVLDSIEDPTAIIREAIDALIRALVENRVGVLIVKPRYTVDVPTGAGLTGFITTLDDAMNDPCDPYRPQFAAGDASAGVVFLISAPTFAEIAALAELFQRLFGDEWQDLIDLARSLPGNIIPARRVQGSGTVTALSPTLDDRYAFFDDTKVTRGSSTLKGHKITMVSGRNTGLESRIVSIDNTTGAFVLAPAFPASLRVGDAYVTMHSRAGQPPNWRSMRVIDVFKPLARVVGLLGQIRDTIGPQTRALAILSDIVDIIERKIALIDAIAGQIQELIDLLQTLGEVTNVSMLPVASQDLGNDGFVAAVRDADNPPTMDDDAVVMGLVVYGGSGVTSVLGSILGPVFG